MHRSLLRDSPALGLQSNERLEFLGDAIIGAYVARFLYDRLPNATEGDLTLLRTWLVRASTLAKWAHELDLVSFLMLGRTDEGNTRQTRLQARTFEAVVGAIFADQGSRGAERFLRRFVEREFREGDSSRPRLDAKSRLQQITQSRFEAVPWYEVASVSGPDHDPTFTIVVHVGAELAVTAHGRTKQQAEQAAAAAALALVEPDDPAAAAPPAGPEEA